MSDLVRLKKFIVVPKDAFDLLTRRFADFDDAGEAAKEAVQDERQQMYLLELKAVASLETPPVRFKKI